MSIRVPIICMLVSAFCSATLSAQELTPVRQAETGRVIAYEVKNAKRVQGLYTANSSQAIDPAAIATSFIESNKATFGILDPAASLKAIPSKSDEFGHVQKYLQYHKGVEVYGSAFGVKMNPDGEVTYVKAKLADELPFSVKPLIKEDKARGIARRLAQAEPESGGRSIAISSIERIILPLGFVNNTPEIDAHLAWKVVTVDEKSAGDFFGMTYFLDAKNGRTLMQLSSKHHLHRQSMDCAAGTGNAVQLNGNVYSSACDNILPLGCGHETDVASNPLYPTYIFGRTEGHAVRGPYPIPTLPYFGSRDTDDLYDLLGFIHNHYLTNFGFNGANGQGGAGKGIVNAGITRGDVNMNSGACTTMTCPRGAVWNSNNGSLAFCLGAAVADTVGHEYTHAVEWYSFPSGYNNLGQSGSMAEGSSDVMGEIIEYAKTGSTDWKDGTFVSGAPIRDLRNPPSLYDTWTSSTYPDRFHSTTVYCTTTSFPHHNSTVLSHAMYLVSQGGQFNGCNIQGQGMDVAQQVLIRGWRNYFSSGVAFNEAYTDIIQACNDLYPPAVCAEVTKALQAAELNQPGKCSGIAEIAPACAVHNEGSVVTSFRQNNRPSTVFAPSTKVWIRGSNGIAGKTVAYYLASEASSYGTWAAYTGAPSGTVNVDSSGNFATEVAVAGAVGSYKIFIDGNNDGFYQPWADTVLNYTVSVSVDGDAVCYLGDSYQTSENCHDDPIDCSCPYLSTCRDINNGNPAPKWWCIQDPIFSPS